MYIGGCRVTYGVEYILTITTRMIWIRAPNPKPKIILNQITYFLLPKIVLIIPTVIVRGRSQLLITVGGPNAKETKGVDPRQGQIWAKNMHVSVHTSAPLNSRVLLVLPRLAAITYGLDRSTAKKAPDFLRLVIIRYIYVQPASLTQRSHHFPKQGKRKNVPLKKLRTSSWPQLRAPRIYAAVGIFFCQSNQKAADSVHYIPLVIMPPKNFSAVGAWQTSIRRSATSPCIFISRPTMSALYLTWSVPCIRPSAALVPTCIDQ